MTTQRIKKLNNGLPIPQIGLGVYKIPEEQVYDTVTSAIANGYRHIDTASFYENEIGVGEAVRDCEIQRKDMFVTTKVWNDEQGYDNTLKAFNRSLEKLKMDYVDLYLIHWPVPDIYAETWRALEHLYKNGRVKAIGVSNFLDHHLKDLLKTAEIKPAVNQIELHPKLIQKSTIEFCNTNDIAIESWAPLGRANYLEENRLVNLARKYNKSPAQIIIRWHVQQEFIVIPKSNNPERQKENLSVFDFELSKEDMEVIDGFNDGFRIGSHPDDIT